MFLEDKNSFLIIFSYEDGLKILAEDKKFEIRKTIFPLQIDWLVSIM